MRLLVDTVIALTLVLVLAAIVLAQREDQAQLQRIAAVQDSIRAIQSQSLFRAGTRESEALSNGYSRFIDARWFENPPQNLLLEGGAFRWIDYPDENGHERFNPLCIVARGEHGAFWYNGYRGLVRARVPMQATEKATVELYNLVNGTSLRISDCRWDIPGLPGVPGDGKPLVASPPQSPPGPSTLLQDFRASAP